MFFNEVNCRWHPNKILVTLEYQSVLNGPVGFYTIIFLFFKGSGAWPRGFVLFLLLGGGGCSEDAGCMAGNGCALRLFFVYKS